MLETIIRACISLMLIGMVALVARAAWRGPTYIGVCNWGGAYTVDAMKECGRYSYIISRMTLLSLAACGTASGAALLYVIAVVSPLKSTNITAAAVVFGIQFGFLFSYWTVRQCEQIAAMSLGEYDGDEYSFIKSVIR